MSNQRERLVNQRGCQNMVSRVSPSELAIADSLYSRELSVPLFCLFLSSSFYSHINAYISFIHHCASFTSTGYEPK
jgi:hypothetical protein